MRDTVYEPDASSYTYTSVYDGTTSGYTAGVTRGKTIRGRSNIIHSNGKNPTPYNAYRGNVRGGNWFMQYTKKYAGGKTRVKTYEGSMGMPPLEYCLSEISSFGHFPILPSHIVPGVKNRLLGKLADIDLNSLVSLGEIRSTAQMIASAVVAGLKAAMAARRGQWAKAYRHLRGHSSLPDKVANTYLGVQYGWRPFISEIQGALSAFDKGLRGGSMSVKATLVETKDVSDLTTRYRREGSWEVGAEGQITFKVSDPSLATAGSLGLTNPFLAAWELIPLSFVVDWFLSVGNYLKGLGATVGLEFGYGHITSFVRSNGVKITRHDRPYWNWDGNSPEWEVDGFAMQRIPFFSWPRPRLVLNLGLNVNQLATTMALAQQRL